MKIELDVHTHTIASGHAYSTLQEMVKAASEKGLKLLGIAYFRHTRNLRSNLLPESACGSSSDVWSRSFVGSRNQYP